MMLKKLLTLSLSIISVYGMKFSKLDKINHIFQQTPIAHVTIDPSLEIEKNKNLMLDPIGDYNCLTTAVIFQEIYRVLEEANLTLEELKHPVKKYIYYPLLNFLKVSALLTPGIFLDDHGFLRSGHVKKGAEKFAKYNVTLNDQTIDHPVLLLGFNKAVKQFMVGYDLSKEDAWVKKKDPYYKSSIYDQQLFGCATENYFNKNPDAWYGVQWSIALKPEKGPGLISYKKIDNKYYSKGKLVEQHTVKRPIIMFIIEIALKAENPETNDEINTSGKENVGNFNVTKALRVTKISEIGTQMPPETLINLAKAADNIDYGVNNELSFTINSVRSQSGINLNHAFFKIMPDTEDHEGITC